ncbi:2224_t:CDS:2 [Entrophospora sp. SA101]|nr:2224_t:CDS:2 [Entrophospora sp. SA101]
MRSNPVQDKSASGEEDGGIKNNLEEGRSLPSSKDRKDVAGERFLLIVEEWKSLLAVYFLEGEGRET